MYPQVFGKYVLERELARGGMARVLLATLRGAEGFEKRLVVKQIRDELAQDPDFVQRFIEEAKTNVALTHPNIVPVYELGVEAGTYYLAMERVEGVSIAELLRATGPLAPEEGAYFGAEICRALDYAHRKVGIVHRDVTPRNVMIDDEGQVKLIDFGIAARARTSGAGFGSPGHMPPEQSQGLEVGPRADVFAVAVLLVEAWSGRAPFRRDTSEASEAAMREPHPRASDADPRLAKLDEIIARSMALDADARPREAEELGRALRHFLQGVDRGDIARALGAKVRAAHKDEAPKPPKRAEYRGLPTPLMIEPATKTFAARDEVRQWTHETPLGAQLRTQPIDLESRLGGAPEAPVELPGRERAPRREDADPPPPAPEPEARAGDGARRSAPRALAALAVVAVGAIAVWRVSSRPIVAPPTALAPASATVPSALDAGAFGAAGAVSAAVPPATTSARAATSAIPSAASTAATAGTTGASSSAAGTTATPSSAAGMAPAHFALFGDPGTRVAVDGTPRGACPIRDLPLEPGPHEFRFSFGPTGEARSERVSAAAGARVVLRADFTGATPTVRVER